MASPNIKREFLVKFVLTRHSEQRLFIFRLLHRQKSKISSIPCNPRQTVPIVPSYANFFCTRWAVFIRLDYEPGYKVIPEHPVEIQRCAPSAGKVSTRP